MLSGSAVESLKIPVVISLALTRKIGEHSGGQRGQKVSNAGDCVDAEKRRVRNVTRRRTLTFITERG